jgi:hypothetical protein
MSNFPNDENDGGEPGDDEDIVPEPGDLPDVGGAVPPPVDELPPPEPPRPTKKPTRGGSDGGSTDQIKIGS